MHKNRLRSTGCFGVMHTSRIACCGPNGVSSTLLLWCGFGPEVERPPGFFLFHVRRALFTACRDFVPCHALAVVIARQISGVQHPHDVLHFSRRCIASKPSLPAITARIWNCVNAGRAAPRGSPRPVPRRRHRPAPASRRSAAVRAAAGVSASRQPPVPDGRGSR